MPEHAPAECAGQDLDDVVQRHERVPGLERRCPHSRNPTEEWHVWKRKGQEVNGGVAKARAEAFAGQPEQPERLHRQRQRGKQVRIEAEAGQEIERDPGKDADRRVVACAICVIARSVAGTSTVSSAYIFASCPYQTP